jgi:hypothetical protein
MLAIGLAFRKEFRFRQLRWGLLAIPWLFITIVVGGYLLSWPLGHWPDLHPLEHPYPWAGRTALFLMLGLTGYSTLKLFSGRVSACAWMIMGWALIFVLGMVLTSKLPTAVHIALLPLAAFGLASVVDLFRKKSPAPLLFASLFGFATAALISFYHFFMLDVVMNFDQSHIKVISFWMMALAVMPMLLAFVKERKLTWQPAKWLLVAILAACLVHLFLPGFTAERPRDMALMYSEVNGEDTGYVVLESLYKTHDRKFARGHDFVMTELNSGRLGTVERPAREVSPLGLPGIWLTEQPGQQEKSGWRREFEAHLPDGSRFLRLTIPKEIGLTKAWVNGELALDNSIETKHKSTVDTLQLIYPGGGPVKFEFLSDSPEAFTLAAVTWHDLPSVLIAPFMGNWPDEAQPFAYGPRAENIQEFELSAVEAVTSSQ